MFTLRELEEQTDEQIIILRSSQCKIAFKTTPNRKQYDFKTSRPTQWVWSIYHLATSRVVFVDNYYGFLAAADFKSNVKCIQLWHAAGAIKQFGLKDLSIENRTQNAYDRFTKVYQQFDHVVVGSEHMANIFREGFGISQEQILRSGVPRTDFFFDTEAKSEVEQTLKILLPVIQEKKVILYAPTYRDNELSLSRLQLDIEKMHRTFKDDYILLLRLHPAVQADIHNKYPDFVVNVSGDYNISHLLIITDILITDYSSIPFEFALLNRPMIFFAYDIDEYAIARGFWDSYDRLAPGPIVETTDELIDVLQTEAYNLNDVQTFAEAWNQYSDGYSSKRLINALYPQAAAIHRARERRN